MGFRTLLSLVFLLVVASTRNAGADNAVVQDESSLGARPYDEDAPQKAVRTRRLASYSVRELKGSKSKGKTKSTKRPKKGSKSKKSKSPKSKSKKSKAPKGTTNNKKGKNVKKDSSNNKVEKDNTKKKKNKKKKDKEEDGKKKKKGDKKTGKCLEFFFLVLLGRQTHGSCPDCQLPFLTLSQARRARKLRNSPCRSLTRRRRSSPCPSCPSSLSWGRIRRSSRYPLFLSWRR